MGLYELSILNLTVVIDRFVLTDDKTEEDVEDGEEDGEEEEDEEETEEVV